MLLGFAGVVLADVHIKRLDFLDFEQRNDEEANEESSETNTPDEPRKKAVYVPPVVELPDYMEAKVTANVPEENTSDEAPIFGAAAGFRTTPRFNPTAPTFDDDNVSGSTDTNTDETGDSPEADATPAEDTIIEVVEAPTYGESVYGEPLEPDEEPEVSVEASQADEGLETVDETPASEAPASDTAGDEKSSGFFHGFLFGHRPGAPADVPEEPAKTDSFPSGGIGTDGLDGILDQPFDFESDHNIFKK